MKTAFSRLADMGCGSIEQEKWQGDPFERLQKALGRLNGQMNISIFFSPFSTLCAMLESAIERLVYPYENSDH